MDALNQKDDDDETRLRRFLLAHALLLAFPGVPAVYIQSILGSRNDMDGVKAAGHNRAINRQKYAVSEIEAALAEKDSLRQRVYFALSQLIQLRTRQPAFHPDNPMKIIDSDNSLLVLKRQAREEQESLWCVFNLSSKAVSMMLPEPRWYRDIASGDRIDGTQSLRLEPWAFHWLKI